MIQIYNTLTNEKKRLNHLLQVKSACMSGRPTRHNYIHIGNARLSDRFWYWFDATLNIEVMK